MTEPLQQPIAWAQIQTALYNWLHESTCLPVVWAFQQSPQRARPFGVLQIISGPTQLGEDEVVYRDDDTNLFADSCGLRGLTVNAQIFSDSFKPGEQAQAYAAQAQSAIEHPRFSQPLADAGIGIISIGAITDLSAIEGARYESRVSFDLSIVIAATIADNISADWFNRAIVNGTQIGPP